jgi:NarL family two-component system response regulator LiaR
MPRIAIVEDRPDISSGLSYIISLNAGFSSKTFVTGEAAVNGITPDEFDVVLMDIQLPNMSGIECTSILKQKYPQLKIMMCTVFEEDDKIFRAIAAGASGYFLKRSEPEHLIRAINELIAGGSHISGDIAFKILKAFRDMIPGDMNSSPLSEREQEVLSLISTGYRNKEVADKLSISLSTVKNHIYSIYQKLHVSSKVEAINKFRTGNK